MSTKPATDTSYQTNNQSLPNKWVPCWPSVIAFSILTIGFTTLTILKWKQWEVPSRSIAITCTAVFAVPAAITIFGRVIGGIPCSS